MIVSYAILFGSLVSYLLIIVGVLLQAEPLAGLGQSKFLKQSA